MEPEVLQTPDGNVIIMTRADYIDVIRKYISDEFADSVETQFSEWEKEFNLEEMKFNSDYEGLEMSCDEYVASLNEVTYLAEQLNICLTEDRLNRKKLKELVNSIKNICGEVL